MAAGKDWRLDLASKLEPEDPRAWPGTRADGQGSIVGESTSFSPRFDPGAPARCNLVLSGLGIGFGQVTKVAAKITLQVTLALLQSAFRAVEHAVAGSAISVPTTIQGKYADMKDDLVTYYGNSMAALEEQVVAVLTDWAKLQALGNACANGTVLTDWRALSSLNDDLQNQAKLGFYRALMPYAWAVGFEPNATRAAGSGHDNAPAGTAWGLQITPSAEEDGTYTSAPSGIESDQSNGPFHSYYLYGTTDANDGYPASQMMMEDLSSLGVRLSDLLAGSAGWEKVPCRYYWESQSLFTPGTAVSAPKAPGS